MIFKICNTKCFQLIFLPTLLTGEGDAEPGQVQKQVNQLLSIPVPIVLSQPALDSRMEFSCGRVEIQIGIPNGVPTEIQSLWVSRVSRV